MALRLTGKDIRNTTILKVDKDNMHIYNTTTEDGEEKTVISCDAITRLGKLEDILEEYGIESVEELEKKIGYLKVIIEKQNIVNQIISKELDTWKRACELACEREDDCYVYDNIHRAYEFYQQAKKEGNDE